MAEGSDWAFSWFKQSPNQTLEKQTLKIRQLDLPGVWSNCFETIVYVAIKLLILFNEWCINDRVTRHIENRKIVTG